MKKHLIVILLIAIALAACKKDDDEIVAESEISVDDFNSLYGIELMTNINNYPGIVKIATLVNPDVDVYEYTNQEMKDQDIYKAILVAAIDTIVEFHLVLEKDHCPVPIKEKYNALVNHYEAKLSEELIHTNQHPTNPTIGCHWLGSINRLVISRSEEYTASVCFVKGYDFLYAH